MPHIDLIPLHETAKERYLNYALSVITSRALPDIRDGLKPVQRRILYAMFAYLRLMPDGRYRKSATVVGETMGKLHPHGDSAIYEAMVRMAQGFALRAPLVDGQGNFGSIDGDNAAAMRYTEAKLRPLALDLLEELRSNTVAFRPTFDGQLSEPVVLPARFPNLLVNGASGIAVGMATNIPPHALGEVLDACTVLIDNPHATLDDVMKVLPGPDFPTGGRLLNTPQELKAIYETGEGALELRGEYRDEGRAVIITSVPYGISKSDLVEKIAEHVVAEKLPQIIDVRDESTDEIRVVLELKKGASSEAAMAYLLKHTPLQTKFHVNLTCLVPTSREEIAVPEKCGLMRVLREFLAFRMSVVERLLRFELEGLAKRIHVLEGLEKIFDVLDEVIRLIRSSKDRADAEQRLMHRFGLTEEQTDAILELKLYRLAQLEIHLVQKELGEKRKRAAEIERLLASETARWKLIRAELTSLKSRHADVRRTTIAGPDVAVAYDVEEYIIDEDTVVMVTRDGWVKRQRSFTDVKSIRTREGDSVGWVLAASTRATIGFFTNFGRVYTTRGVDIPATTGHGTPIQKLFDFTDKERIVGVVAFDDRHLPKPIERKKETVELFESGPAPTEFEGPYLVALTRFGSAIRFLVEAVREPSNKNGRLFARLEEKDEILMVEQASGLENVCLATRNGNVLIFPVDQISLVRGPAKGVTAIRLVSGDAVLGFMLSGAARDGLEVETSRGRKEIVRTTKFPVSNRGNKGKSILQRGTLSRVVEEPVVRV